MNTRKPKIMHRSSLIFLVIILISCSKESIDSDAVIRINSGIRYGFCVGYCAHEVEITFETTTYTKSGTRVDTLPDQSCGGPTEQGEWKSLVDLVDPAFHRLDSVVGCPDCVDQGAEFIEVITSTCSHVVTFDPTLKEEIHPLVGSLRDLRAKVIESEACK
ncbi:MAG: hypothetical protein HKN87_04340 [Saprospiraceae bacterium]|nr:hypothetical protein [Saprospiraceae bacterium]